MPYNNEIREWMAFLIHEGECKKTTNSSATNMFVFWLCKQYISVIN
jgi:hypothetical protein